MTLKDRMTIFFRYKVPRFFNKHFGRARISDKGMEFFDYCVKILQDENYEAETYQEMMFEEMVDNLRKEDGLDRKTAAAIYLDILMPYVNIEFVEGDKK